MKKSLKQSIATSFALLVGLVASASADPSIGLGADGAPAASNYLSSAHIFQGSIAPLLAVLLVFLLAMYGVWQGPTIVMRLIDNYMESRADYAEYVSEARQRGL